MKTENSNNPILNIKELIHGEVCMGTYGLVELELRKLYTKEQVEDLLEQQRQLSFENSYCDLIHPYDEDYPELIESEYKVVKNSILDNKLIF